MKRILARSQGVRMGGRWGVALLGLLCATQAEASSPQSVPAEKGSGIAIEISCVLDTPPMTGAVPLRLSIHNNSNRTGTWTFTSHLRKFGSYTNSLDTTLRVTVEAGKSRTVPMVALLASNGTSDPSYGYFQVNVQGPAVSHTATFTQVGGSYNPRTRYLAMSRELAARSWEPLKKQLDNEKMTLNGSAFDAADLGADWRGYAGIDFLALSEPEWTKLGADVQAAIRQWVGFGGHLLVLRLESSSFRLVPGEDPLAYGFGDLREATWDGKEAPSLLFSSQIKSPGRSWNQPADKSWSLLAGLGELKPNEPLILGFVLLFALLVGPTNLFYFAPASRRHRLFWTTPLMAVGGSALLMVVILFQEGVGGRGARCALIRLMPETHEALVLQEQVSRTSLLMGRGFRLGEDVFAQPVPLGEERQNCDLTLEGRDYGGDWFRSRSIQGHRFATARSTRAAITILGTDPSSGALIVVSSIESPLDKLVIKEKSGRVWSADQVRTGEKTTLVKAQTRDLNAWWNQVTAPMSAGLHATASLGTVFSSQGSDPEGTFFASVSNPKSELLPSLSSIRWSGDRAVYMGPVTKPSTQTGAPQQ